MSFRKTYGTFLMGDENANNFVLDNTNEPDLAFYGANTAGGNDTVTLNGNFDARVNTGTGDDEVNINNDSGNINVKTEEGDDTVTAYVGDETVLNIDGGEGDDDIYFLGKNSRISGGRGSDYISLDTAVIQNELHPDPFVVNAIGNTIDAGEGDDFISVDAGSKDNTISGGQGDDIFIFKNKLPGFIANEKEFFDPSKLELIQGTNTITDFELNNPNEKIDLQNWDETSFDDLEISQDGEDTRITNAQGQTIILKGIIPSQLSADNFIFRIEGDDNNNLINGGKFVGTINGEAGNDNISTQAKDATFTGGEGNDRFVISKMDAGQVVEITDFEINNHNEKIVLKDFDNLNFDDLKIEYLDDVDGAPAALITLSDNQAIIVNGATKDSPLTADNFYFKNTPQNTIDGTNNNDNISVGAANSIINGLDGDDEISIYSSYLTNNKVDGGAGNDKIIAGGEELELHGGSGDDYLYIFTNYNNPDSIGGLSKVFGDSGDDEIHMFGGDDFIETDGGDGDDYIQNYANDTKILGGKGNDRLELALQSTVDFYGLQTLTSASNNNIDGGEGDDIFDIKVGNTDNNLTGGAGDDIFSFKSKSPYNYELRSDLNTVNTIVDFEINNHNEKIDLQDWNESSFENLTIVQNGLDTVVSGSDGVSIILKNIDSTKLSADNFIFKFNGDAENNIINGGKFIGVINGGEGNDTISTESQDATFTGGAGDDRFVVNKTDGKQFVKITDLEINNHNEKIVLKGFDNLNFDDLKIEYFYSYEGSQGALVTLSDKQKIFVDSATQDSPLTADNFIFGNEPQGPNYIFSDGNEFVQGTDRDDVITISQPLYPTAPGTAAASIFGSFNINAGEGNDTVIFDTENNISFDLTNTNIENVIGGEGKNYITAFGTSSAVNITGGSKADIIIGSIGDDHLTGGAGNDKLTGSGGADSLFGGAGEDQFNYTFAIESNPLYGADHIKDFAQGEDKINFSEMNNITKSVLASMTDGMIANPNASDLLAHLPFIMQSQGFYSFNQINKLGESNDINSLVYHYDETSGNTVIESQDHQFQINVAGQVDFNNGDFIF